MQPEHQRVVDELRAGGGGSFREIAARLGDDPELVRERLEWLRRRRHVRHNGVVGVWWIPR
jgi:DNA-binding Lrp family transcriptional regulator